MVKAVMLGLLLASIWTWAIIFTHSIRLKRINRQTDRFERDFWAASDIDAFHSSRGDRPAADRGGHVGGDGRMAPLDQDRARSTAPAPASGSPAG